MYRKIVPSEATPRAKLGTTLGTRVGIGHHVQAFHVPLHVLARGAALGAESAGPEFESLTVPTWLHVLGIERVQLRVGQSHCKQERKKIHC